MQEIYKSFQALHIDTSPVGLSRCEHPNYFCTPVGAKIIGWDNGIHYCFIQGFDETVFCVNPESCCEHYVYPIAKNFHDFLSLILAANTTNTLQQVIWWDRHTFEKFINDKAEIAYAATPEVVSVLNAIRTELKIEPMAEPFEYIKKLQKDFPYEQINFSDEFYDVTGIER